MKHLIKLSLLVFCLAFQACSKDVPRKGGRAAGSLFENSKTQWSVILLEEAKNYEVLGLELIGTWEHPCLSIDDGISQQKVVEISRVGSSINKLSFKEYDLHFLTTDCVADSVDYTKSFMSSSVYLTISHGFLEDLFKSGLRALNQETLNVVHNEYFVDLYVANVSQNDLPPTHPILIGISERSDLSIFKRAESLLNKNNEKDNETLEKLKEAYTDLNNVFMANPKDEAFKISSQKATALGLDKLVKE
jgi:hypothetical protein